GEGWGDEDSGDMTSGFAALIPLDFKTLVGITTTIDSMIIEPSGSTNNNNTSAKPSTSPTPATPSITTTSASIIPPSIDHLKQNMYFIVMNTNKSLYKK